MIPNQPTAAGSSFNVQAFSLQTGEHFNAHLPERWKMDDHFSICWTFSGAGYHIVDEERLAFDAASIFCMRPGQSHLVKAVFPIEGLVISFTETGLYHGEQGDDLARQLRFIRLITQAGIIVPGAEQLEEMRAIIDKMNREFKTRGLFREELLSRYLKILLMLVVREFNGSFREPAPVTNVKLVHDFMSLLEENYATNKSVTEYASQLAVTPNYLNFLIKKSTGQCVSHHIRERVLLEAKRKAAFPGSCMKDIAYTLGFNDLAHFSKYFKKSIGKSFSQFRRDVLPDGHARLAVENCG